MIAEIFPDQASSDTVYTILIACMTVNAAKEWSPGHHISESAWPIQILAEQYFQQQISDPVSQRVNWINPCLSLALHIDFAVKEIQKI